MPFKVRDLMVNVIRAEASGAGSASLPADDTQPVPTPITPIAIDASLIALTPQLQFTEALAKDALGAKQGAAELLARAALGAAEGSPALLQANRDLAGVLVGAAALQTKSGGGAGMPDPDCGNSLEHIPTPLTPYVRKAATLLRPEDLYRLKSKLTVMLSAVDAAEKSLRPTGKAAVELSARLQAAAKELEAGAGAKA